MGVLAESSSRLLGQRARMAVNATNESNPNRYGSWSGESRGSLIPLFGIQTTTRGQCYYLPTAGTGSYPVRQLDPKTQVKDLISDDS